MADDAAGLAHAREPGPGEDAEALRRKVRTFVESRGVTNVILAVIIANAVLLGLDTDRQLHARFNTVFAALDALVTFIFVMELGLKLYARGFAFFRGAWNCFDLAVVLISLLPDAGAFAVLRVLRVFRVFRLFSLLPALRRVVDALFKAIPGMGAILAVLGVLFYVFAVMATNLFGRDGRPEMVEMFATTPRSAFTLFQIMTLDGWSSEVMRVVMQRHPWAWTFFLPFIVLTSFAVLNLFIAVIVEALQAEHKAEMDEVEAGLEEAREEIEETREEIREEFAEEAHRAADDREALLAAIAALRAEVAAMRAELTGRQRVS